MQKSSLYKFCTLFSSLMTTVCMDAGVLYLLTEQMPQVKLETWYFISSMKSRLCTCLWQVRTYSRQEFWEGSPSSLQKKNISWQTPVISKIHTTYFPQILKSTGLLNGRGDVSLPTKSGFCIYWVEPSEQSQKVKARHLTMSTGNKSHSHLQALLPFSWASSQEANMANKILGNSWTRFTIIWMFHWVYEVMHPYSHLFPPTYFCYMLWVACL